MSQSYIPYSFGNESYRVKVRYNYVDPFMSTTKKDSEYFTFKQKGFGVSYTSVNKNTLYVSDTYMVTTSTINGINSTLNNSYMSGYFEGDIYSNSSRVMQDTTSISITLKDATIVQYTTSETSQCRYSTWVHFNNSTGSTTDSYSTTYSRSVTSGRFTLLLVSYDNTVLLSSNSTEYETVNGSISYEYTSRSILNGLNKTLSFVSDSCRTTTYTRYSGIEIMHTISSWIDETIMSINKKIN